MEGREREGEGEGGKWGEGRGRGRGNGEREERVRGGRKGGKEGDHKEDRMHRLPSRVLSRLSKCFCFLILPTANFEIKFKPEEDHVSCLPSCLLVLQQL